MRKSLPCLALILVGAGALPGCKPAAPDNANLLPTPTPTPSPTPTIVVKAYPADMSKNPKKVLDALKATTGLSVEPNIWPLSGVSEPVALVSSEMDVDPAIDTTVCGVVKKVYEGAVIRKVGSIDPDHRVIVSLPMPSPTPSPAPTDTKPC